MERPKRYGDLSLGGWISFAFVIFWWASVVFYPAFAGATLLLACGSLAVAVWMGGEWPINELMFVGGGSITLYSLSVLILHVLKWTGCLPIELEWVTLCATAGASLGVFSFLLFLGYGR